MIELCNVTKEKVETLLKSLRQNCDLEDVKEAILSWSFKSDEDVDSIKADLCDLVEYLKNDLFPNNTQVHFAVHCFVHNTLHENLMPIIKTCNKDEDATFYEKCRELFEKKIDPREYSTNEFSSLPFTAAVVELSMLDVYQSPLEKMNCLCTTYDLIFAELKSSLVSLISKYSDKEVEIPVIDNEEVFPILQFVLVRSKLYYFHSNLFYVRCMGEEVLNLEMREILNIFEKSSKLLFKINKNNNNKQDKELKASEMIEALMKMDSTAGNVSNSIKEEYKKRYLSLITLSTDTNYIPIKM